MDRIPVVRRLSAALVLILSLTLGGCCGWRYCYVGYGEDSSIWAVAPGDSAGLGLPSMRYLVTLNGSSRAFVTDEKTGWRSLGLGRYFPSGGSIYAGLVVGPEVIAGTDQGIGWVNSQDGTWGHYSGAPTSYTVALAPWGASGFFAGVYYGSSNGAPSLYFCDQTSHSCTLSTAGMTMDQYNYPIGAFAAVTTPPPVGTGFDAASLATTVFAGTLYQNGVFRTTDGKNWTPCRTGLPTTISIRSLFAAGGTLFLGSDATYSASSAGLYVSTNQGASWTKAAGLSAGPVLGIGGDASAVYAGVNASGARTVAAVYKSTDLGLSWNPTSNVPIANVNGIAAGDLGVYLATNGGTFRTTDGGATWQSYGQGKDNATVLAVLPVGGSLLVGTQGDLSGVQRSTDDGRTWTPGDATIANKVVASLAAAGSTIVGSGPNGTFRSLDGGATWSASSSRVFAAVVSSGGTFYGANALFGSNIVAVYSSPDGIAWSAANGGLPPNAGATALAASGTTLYAGIGPAVYSSTNGGGSWTAGGKVWAADTTYQISCLAVIDGVLFAGLTGYGAAPETYGYYKSLDGGKTWSSIRSGLPPNSYAYSIAGIGTSLFAGMQRGLYQSTDGGNSWAPFGDELYGVPVNALATNGETLWAGTSGDDVERFVLPVQASQLVPIVLDVASGTAHYTTELALTNRGTTGATVTMTYTASLGSGSGTATESVAAGRQLVIPDVIGYLRGKGLAIPTSGSQAGTLGLAFAGISGRNVVAATARTATSTAAPQPVGRAGLAYPAAEGGGGGNGGLTVYALRSSATDRSNLAVISTSANPVTVKVTAFAGDGSGRTFVVAAGDVLPGWGWKQYNGILDAAGFASGWVKVERTSTTGEFGAYGVINDNGTNDGSYVLPSAGRTDFAYLNVPVLVETPSFQSELALANSGTTAATLTLTYRESLSPSAGAGGTLTLAVPAGTQQIIPNIIAFMRQRGVSVGPAGGSYAGSLHIGIAGALASDLYVGARTASPSPAGGQFGLFTPAFSAGSEAMAEAYVYGLRADSANRSNVAVANTSGTATGGPITLQLQAYDGDAGGVAKGSPLSVTLAPGQWSQASGFLGAQGVANGWVKVTRTAGNAPWIAYGVVNDGGGPGQGTGDGAYVPMVR